MVSAVPVITFSPTPSDWVYCEWKSKKINDDSTWIMGTMCVHQIYIFYLRFLHLLDLSSSKKDKIKNVTKEDGIGLGLGLGLGLMVSNHIYRILLQKNFY